jgi:monoterpene epsilon-lactone hydrolase
LREDRLKLRNNAAIVLAIIGFATVGCQQAPQPAAPAPIAESDAATLDANGTLHVARVIPMPSTVSPEAQKYLDGLNHRKATAPESLEDRRKHTDEWRAKQSAEAKRLFPVKVEEATTAGVRTDIITPLDTPVANRDRVLINLHGGGFNSDSGSLIEGVPIANLAKIKVVSVYYRLAPENPFPAAVDDVVAVYKELLKTYKPKKIGIFGTSAGATLTAEVASKLKQDKLPMPGALGMFSAHPDYSRPTDSQEIYTLAGFAGALSPRDPSKPPEDPYAGSTDRKDPVLSPIFADLKGWPPSLLVTSTRDILLSDTSMFHLALLNAGVDSQLLVYEALPHAFWYHYDLPETTDALNHMSKFFVDKLGK